MCSISVDKATLMMGFAITLLPHLTTIVRETFTSVTAAEDRVFAVSFPHKVADSRLCTSLAILGTISLNPNPFSVSLLNQEDTGVVIGVVAKLNFAAVSQHKGENWEGHDGQPDKYNQKVGETS